MDKGPQQKKGLHQKPSTPKQDLGSRSNLATSVVTTSTWEASVRVASSSEDTGQGDAQLPPLLPEARSRSRSASSSPGHRRHGPRPLSVLTRTTTNTSVADSLLHQNPILKEHEPLTTLLGLIPAKAQKGMFSECELQLTCIAANGDYLALGTNVGLVFMYNRKKRCLDRLRCDVSISFFAHLIHMVKKYDVYQNNLSPISRVLFSSLKKKKEKSKNIV